MLLDSKISTRLFVCNENKSTLSQSNVSSSLTSRFKKAKVFCKDENNRVCCTRIRVTCATLACNEGGFDMGYIAKNFMKNREQTTAAHYNMFANHRDALCIASYIGNTFQVYDGEIVILSSKEQKELSTAMNSMSINPPNASAVINWMKQHDKSITSAELDKYLTILNQNKEDSLVKKSLFFYGNMKDQQVS